MDIVVGAVKKLEELLEHSGCSDSGILLDVDPHVTNCQFERGACMTAVLGGKCGIFTTFDPIRARTRISFMFDVPLDTPAVRGAAGAIINASAGFFCLVRVLRPCDPAAHAACRKNLADELGRKNAFCLESDTQTATIDGVSLTPEMDAAAVILINGDGIIHNEAGNIVTKYRKEKRILCLGPSTVGIARLFELDHWCPFGSK